MQESTVGQRLRKAVEAAQLPGERAGSIRAFQRAIEKQLAGHGGKAGTSLPALHSYLADTSTPSLEWLHEAARLLNVRPAWLILGQEPMTGAEQAASGAARKREGQVTAGASVEIADPRDLTARPEDMQRAYLQGMPALKNATDPSWYVIGGLFSQYTSTRPMLRRFAAVTGKHAGPNADARALKRDVQRYQVEAAAAVAEMIAAGAESAGVDLAKLSTWQLDRYIQTTAQALSVLFARSIDVADDREWKRAGPEGISVGKEAKTPRKRTPKKTTRKTTKAKKRTTRPRKKGS